VQDQADCAARTLSVRLSDWQVLMTVQDRADCALRTPWKRYKAR
jgi:hypothetical protein